jgi:polyphosphate kinase
MADLDRDVEAVAAPRLGDERFINRELSWLDFDERVLALAEDETRPLLERAKFLAIFSSNLDEFFQVRVAGLREQVRAGVAPISPELLGPAAQLSQIGRRVREIMSRADALFIEDLVPSLEKERVRFTTWEEAGSADRAGLDAYFERYIYPVLTPLAVDPAHPFPYISNLSLNLAVVVTDPVTSVERFARVKIPPSLPRFVALPDGERFMLLEHLIAGRLDVLFPGMHVRASHIFRVTRNADLSVEEDEADDLLEAIEFGLRQRQRSPHVVRLEIGADMPDEISDVLADELDITNDDIYVTHAMLDYTGLFALGSLDRPELKDAPWTPTTQPRLAAIFGEGDDRPTIFDVIREGDVLVHHPYDSFASSVETFIEAAANDPDVLAIKWTLYRTSGPESPIIRNLLSAPQAGKQVVALVELKARFDEAANIAWARALEEAGVHVVYGLVGLKTHAKIALVVRQERGTIVRYTHIGTGNYNPNTATIYEDIGMFSADPEIGADVSELFNFLTGYSRQSAFRKLTVAPLGLRRRLKELIGHEAKAGGRIVMKLNNIVDPEIIDALYAASGAGASIDLIVRGICCLRPGLPGLSENIRVRSILGRFLEHSRILRFGADDATAEYYIGSPDVMARNLDGRIEVLVPVSDPAIKPRLAEVLAVELADDLRAWQLAPDGSWSRTPTKKAIGAQQRLRHLATQRAGIDRR